ncbi:DUF885 domain-containing protein [Amycolatopsis sp. CA-230715]|uniref:DUF885 domain-containing protein n=1 Tax=Amycolatopsis sp. CA-230715 TaxID=2745196 RepID=UPI001C00F185|nr:DUF885 domain-containing protein [Amycolatopsis sp. CA-230715]QWF76974.1 hypothetical protein HUW46_00354 [Amycolatopsis sp. CA-230715]
MGRRERGGLVTGVESPAALADELTGALFEADPLRPMLLGLPGSSGLPDPSRAAGLRHRERFAGISARAEALPVPESEVDVVTLEVVRQQAKAAIDLIDAGLGDFAVNDSFAAPALIPLVLMPNAVPDTAEKAEAHLDRLAAFPSYLDAVCERQRAGADEGLVAAAFLVREGIAAVERYLGNPLTDPLRLDAKAAGFADRQERLLTESVRPAYSAYRNFLRDEVAPKALPDEKPGLCWLSGGEARYEALIRAHTTTERSARELHETGLAFVERLGDEYRELGARVFGVTDLGELFARLRTDPALRWGDADEMLEAARTSIGRAEAAAPRWFGKLPSASCAITAMPEHEADGGSIAYYFEPALDGSRPGTYYVNTFRARERFRHESDAVAFHEGVPGHHLQNSLSLALADLPLLRRVAEVNAYLEGWALYAERLADEMGLYTDDVSRFGLLAQDSLRAGRLVVDTGMHALGWSRERAVEYLRVNSPMPPVAIEAEIDRYAGCPGQALSYMVGRLEIQRVRAHAEEALGERFDIRAFHDEVLGHGVLPLSVLDGVIRRWITRVSV